MKEAYFQKLTDVVLEELKKIDIVTPDIFNEIYIAKVKELNLEDKIDISNIPNDAILEKYYKIQEETKNSADALSENAKQAQVAIKNQDQTMLDEVNSKMQTLLDKISHLQEQVYLDELTKIYNRKYLFEEVLAHDNFKGSGTITFIDLDKFKYINDTFGHIVGDKVLSMTAKMLKEIKEGEVIRYGGDEFIVISKLPKKNVEIFFKNLINRLKKKSFKYQDNKFKIEFSYGVEDFEKGESFSKIVDKVDEVMYKQKKAKKEAQKALEVA